MRLSLYTPHQLTAARLDGDMVEVVSIHELGYGRYEVLVELPANSTRRVEYELEGIIAVDRPYEVAVWHQPLVNTDLVRIAYQDQPPREVELVETTLIAVEN